MPAPSDPPPPRVARLVDTPNPNAIKCLLSAPVTGPRAADIRSYFNHAAAREAADPLALALFGIPGVTNILIHPGPPPWITVSKAPEAPWPPITRALDAALAKAHSNG